MKQWLIDLEEIVSATNAYQAITYRENPSILSQDSDAIESFGALHILSVDIEKVRHEMENLVSFCLHQQTMFRNNGIPRNIIHLVEEQRHRIVKHALGISNDMITQYKQSVSHVDRIKTQLNDGLVADMRRVAL